MSQLTNYGENKLADFFRGQAIGIPDGNWYLAPLSAASDSSVTEITGVGLGRVTRARSLANWAGTQGDGTTLASSGTTHTTSNNVAVNLGTASGSGTLVGVGFFDAASGGNCWMVWLLDTPLAFASSDVVSLAIGQIKFSLGLSGGMSDYLANKLIDLIFRAQSYSFPTAMWHALYTAAPSNAGGGTEVGGGVGYSRAELQCDLSSICGTQGAGTTTASSGTGGRIANNDIVTHPEPSGTWGTCTHGGWKDLSSGGNLLFWGELANPLSLGLGSPAPSYAADQFEIIIA
jgi:hypothetical protein